MDLKRGVILAITACATSQGKPPCEYASINLPATPCNPALPGRSCGFWNFRRPTREIDPLMGWTISDDMQSQVRLRFETRKQAEEYARAHGLDFVVQEPQKRAPNIRPRGYGENFATDRRAPGRTDLCKSGES